MTNLNKWENLEREKLKKTNLKKDISGKRTTIKMINLKKDTSKKPILKRNYLLKDSSEQGKTEKGQF